MTASTKFDFPSSFSDGSVHPNGQRGPHASASLERPGSFREGNEGRILSSLPSTSRTGSLSSQADAINMLQTVISDLKTVVSDQKFSRPGDLTRSINSILGISAEDSLSPVFNIKPLLSSSVEEIKRLRSNLHEGAGKARDRAKAFGESALKMDKFYNTLQRKRSRNDSSSTERLHTALLGGNVPRMGTQGHLTASSLELGPPKSEERPKNVVPNRRIRTSLVEVRMDARASTVASSSGSMDKDKDLYKLVNGGATPSEEKGRDLPTVVDGWEKSKMKKKRSVIKSDASGSAVLARPHDNDRELKRGMQQKLVTDVRPRLNNTHGFRSGPATGMAGVGKLDSASQTNGVGSRPFPRDPDNCSLHNDRRDRIVGCDKDGANLKATSKPNNHEDSHAASPTSVMKMNTSVRGPRSNSGSLSKASSPKLNRLLGNSDDWEHPQCTNKTNSAVGVANRKRSASVRSPSPPVGQWGGQRPQKITRVARRSNLPPVVSSHEEYPLSEMHDTTAIHEDELGFTRRSSTNASQQSKSKGDQVLSESEESGVVDNKSKDKSKKFSEAEEKSGSSVQKVSSLVLTTRKNKVAAQEALEDNIGKHGKIGRGVTPARSSMPATMEKLDSAATTKHMRSVQINNEKMESKPGRPPTKKWSERKGHTPLRPSVNGGPLDSAGESDDDHEELLAAANAALNTGKACSSTFWKEAEEFFGFLSLEDTDFLNEQIHLTEETTASTCGYRISQSLKGDHEYNSLPSTPTVSSRGVYSGSPNGISTLNEYVRDIEPATQTNQTEPFLEELLQENGTRVGVSICQALLSAFIGEEEIENLTLRSYDKDDCLYGNRYGIHFDVDTELKLKNFNFQSLGTFEAAERLALNSYKANTGWGYNDEHEDLGSNGMLDELLPNMAMTASTICSDYQYNQMSINDRILLELNEIGLYPEPVPYLEQSEDEDIVEGISRLKEKLHEQVAEKKILLLKLGKAVKETRNSQQRELECIALDKLVEMSYEKYMACWGPASGCKNMVRTNKQATQAFIKRTLARCQKFEKSKVSCFRDPPFREMFNSASFQNGDRRNIDLSANAAASYQFAPARHSATSLSDQNRGLLSQSAREVDIHEKYPDAVRSANPLTNQTCGSEDAWSTKLKKKELLLDDVVGSALRVPSGLGSSLVSGTKGKRSERDREGKGQNRDTGFRNGTAKIGRPAVSNAKVEKKNKSKTKQRTTQLSASVNGLIGKATDTSNKITRETVARSSKKDELGLHSNLPDDAEAVDLSNLQLPEIDVGDFGAQGEDIASWLSIEEDALQDIDYMGLQIPMDDLSQVNMMI